MCQCWVVWHCAQKKKLLIISRSADALIVVCSPLLNRLFMCSPIKLCFIYLIESAAGHSMAIADYVFAMAIPFGAPFSLGKCVMLANDHLMVISFFVITFHVRPTSSCAHRLCGRHAHWAH